MRSQESFGEALHRYVVIYEVSLAVLKRYGFVEIIVVYEYVAAQYDPRTGQGGPFVEYIETFFKLMTEASGKPARVRTPEDEDSYIINFFANEGIRLEKEAIRPNAVKRCLA